MSVLRLKLPTDPRWVNIVETNIEEILSDHAWCEQKAASNAITIITINSEYPDLVSDMLALAKEEELAFVISNTTESGIAYLDTDTPLMQPPSSYPAKLAVLLYIRYKHFNGDPTKGLAIIPCELINNNADTLKKIILQYHP